MDDISLQEKILAAVLALSDVKEPTTLINEWAAMHANDSLVDLLALGFPDDLLDQLHTACLSNTTAIKRQNRNTLQSVTDAVKLLPSVVAPIKKRRYVV